MIQCIVDRRVWFLRELIDRVDNFGKSFRIYLSQVRNWYFV